VKTGTELSVVGMCSLAGFSRAGYYRAQQVEPKPSQEDLRVRDAMHRVALEWPSYGSRRMSRELRKRGMKVNRKRLQRLMREDNLLCVAKRKFVVTTDSAHPLPVYPNLPPTMNVTGINQLWIADITYIRLEEEFIYLAVILDAFSRRVIGWSLDDTMAESLTLAALQMALNEREAPPGLVHHSDRGVQYAAGAYTQLLKDNGITISMSRKGNPWDNAACESFMKTLKHEEVHRTEYRNLADARTRIGRFLESIYNDRRMHSSLSYLSPSEFERNLTPGHRKKEAA
jgi:transposase InsO family protein